MTDVPNTTHSNPYEEVSPLVPLWDDYEDKLDEPEDAGDDNDREN